MFGFLLGLAARPAVSLLIGAVLVLQTYWLLRPEDESLGFARRVLAGNAAAQIAADVPDRPGLSTIAVLPFANDPTGVIAKNIRRSVAARGRYEVIEESMLTRWLAEWRGAPAPVTTLDGAVTAARRVGADLVLFGEIARFARDADDMFVAIELRVAERDSGQAVFARRYEDRVSGTPASFSYWRARIADSSKPQRTLIWCCFAAFLPVLTISLIRRVTAEESNVANSTLLVAYALTIGGAAVALTGFWLASWWTVLVVIAAAGVGGFYTYKVATLVEQLR